MGDEASSLNLLEGGIIADHPTRETHPVLVAPTTADHFNVVKAALEPVACFKLEDARFEFDSSFILPEVAGEMKELARLHKKHPDAPLSIFGHADPTGRDEYNKKLSGQRATAMYGLLTRDTALWETLNGENNWGVKANQIMLNTLGHDAGIADGTMTEQTRTAVRTFQGERGLTADGSVGPNTRKELYKAYMDAIAKDDNGQPFKLEKTNFLTKGKGKDLKGDIQGCGEFNPLLLFSNVEKAELDKKENQPEQNEKNKQNRRVMILLFKPGNEVEPAKWPCPTVKEGVKGCKDRFFSDGEKRRQNTEEGRKFEETKDTFACRFYQRLTDTSPCERATGNLLLHISIILNRDLESGPMVNQPFRLFLNNKTIDGNTGNDGRIEHAAVPPGDYRLEVAGKTTFVSAIPLNRQKLKWVLDIGSTRDNTTSGNE